MLYRILLPLFVVVHLWLLTSAAVQANEAVMSPTYAGKPLVDGLPLQALFPKATRFGDKESDLPVYAAYQLDELLGYAWLSDEINNLAGFAGKPIRLLIGLKPDGSFQDVTVIDHHEPVFLHGLGNESMHEFLAQYRNRSVRNQIIVGSAQNSQLSSQSDGGASGTVVFDGVTKATISVMIINDVVLSTALQVARARLEGFALPTQSRLLEKPITSQSWEALANNNLIHQWTLSQTEVEESLGRSLNSYPEFSNTTAPNTPFITLAYAYLNAPQVGVNLLGEARYKALMDRLTPGDHLLWVGSSGLYPHAEENYTPATVPSRLSLDQGGLSVEIRDINAPSEFNDIITPGAPRFSTAHFLRIKGSAGFDPGSPVDLKLHVNLARNHLISDSATFLSHYQLPDSEWEPVQIDTAKPLPLWIKLWMDRWVSVCILLIGLTVLIVSFIKQDRLSRWKHFHAFRWGYLAFTLFFIGFYAQGQLSVVNIFTLFHSIKDGFDITIFLLDPVIFILWIVTFISLFIWGRGLFCGWLCPFGALQEMSSWLGKKIGLKQIRVPATLHRRLIYLKYPIIGGLVAVSFYSLTWAEKLSEVEPFKTSITLVFIRHWPFVLYAVGLLIVGMFIHKFYCRYLCPLGAGLAAIGWLRRFELLKRVDFCGSPCQTCHHRCEIKAIKKSGEIDYNECVQCLECIVILNDEEQCVDKLLTRKKQKKAIASQRIPSVQIHQPS